MLMDIWFTLTRLMKHIVFFYLIYKNKPLIS